MRMTKAERKHLHAMARGEKADIRDIEKAKRILAKVEAHERRELKEVHREERGKRFG